MDYKTLNASTATDADISAMVSTQLSNVDDKGKLQLPDDMPDWQKRIVRSEKRQRDAQSTLGKTNEKLKTLEATNKLLAEKQTLLPADLGLSQDEIRELQTLATSNPEQYRLRMNAAESNAKRTAKEELDKELKRVEDEAINTHITENRVTVLQQFRDANPDLALTDDVLANDVPPRFMVKLNSGEYTNYGEYLEAVKEYLTKGSIIPEGNKGEKLDLSDMGGSSTPGKTAGDNQKIKDLSKVSL